MPENIEIKWLPQERLVSDLKEWPQNPRKIKDTDFARLKDRIQKRGMHDVLLVDLDGTILSGNMRKKALTELGIDTVLTLYPNRPLSDEEKTQIALEMNRNDGQWDYDILGNSFDVPLLLDIGFTEKELGITGYSEPTDVENEPEPIKEKCQYCGK